MIKPASKPIAKAKIASGRKPPETALTWSSCNGRICGMDSDWINSLMTSSFGLLERSSATTGRFCRNDPPVDADRLPCSGHEGRLPNPGSVAMSKKKPAMSRASSMAKLFSPTRSKRIHKGVLDCKRIESISGPDARVSLRSCGPSRSTSSRRRRLTADGTCSAPDRIGFSRVQGARRLHYLR